MQNNLAVTDLCDRGGQIIVDCQQYQLAHLKSMQFVASLRRYSYQLTKQIGLHYMPTKSSSNP